MKTSVTGSAQLPTSYRHLATLARHARPIAMGLVFGAAFVAVQANAQATPPQAQVATGNATPSSSRAQVKMERDEFLRTHSFDSATDNWVLKSGIEPPMGMKSRADVKASRDDFLRNHRYDAPTQGWVPMDSAPRDLSTMSRAQVQTETRQFLRTHSYDGEAGIWVDSKPVKPKA